MERSTEFMESRRGWYLASAMALWGTLFVLISVINRWHAFSRPQRSAALPLVLCLVAYPVSFLWNLRKGNPMSIQLVVVLGYSLLMLVTATFVWG